MIENLVDEKNLSPNFSENFTKIDSDINAHKEMNFKLESIVSLPVESMWIMERESRKLLPIYGSQIYSWNKRLELLTLNPPDFLNRHNIDPSYR